MRRSVSYRHRAVDVKQFGVVGDGVTDDSANLQTAIDTAIERDFALFFPEGIYLAQGLYYKGEGVESLVVEATDKAKWKLTAGGYSFLKVEDIRLLDIDGVDIEATDAGTDPTGAEAVVLFQTTADTQGQQDFECFFRNISGVGKPASAGGLRVRIKEDPGQDFSKAKRVLFENISWKSWGNTARNPIGVRGPTELLEVKGATFRNDGEFGFEAFGPATYQGSGNLAMGFSCEVGFGHFIEELFISNVTATHCTGTLFTQMVAHLNGENILSRGSCINSYHDSGVSTFTSDQATSTITTTVPPGFTDRAYVQVTGPNLPAPLVSGNWYYVRDTLATLAYYAGGPAITFTSPGSGNIQWMGVTFSSDIKGDDNRTLEDEIASDGVHSFKNVRFVDPTPHSLHRDLAYEKGATTPHVVAVRIDNCDFSTLVNLLGTGSLASHIVRDSRFHNIRNSLADTGVGSSLTIQRGSVINNVFAGNRVQMNTQYPVTIRDNLFHENLTLIVSGSEVVKVIDNLFDASSGPPRALNVTGPSPGTVCKLDLLGNRSFSGPPLILNISTPTGGNPADLIVTSNFNDF